MDKDKKLKTKDLIYAGAFGAIYIVIMLLIVMASGMVPVLYLMAPLIVGVINATVYMLYALKVHKFGAVLILGVLFALVTSLNSWYGIVFALAAAIIAEMILKAGAYKSRKNYLISYIFFNMNMAAPTLMLLVDHQRFMTLTSSYYSEEHSAKFAALTAGGRVWFLILAGALIGALIGSLIASRLIKKHFEKAGVI